MSDRAELIEREEIIKILTSSITPYISAHKIVGVLWVAGYEIVKKESASKA